MAQLTISETIDVAGLSIPIAANYEAQGDLFGKRLAVASPTVIAVISDALKWQYEAFPDIPEVQALGSITIGTNTNGWTSIEIFVNDPYLGTISFGKSYTSGPGQSSASIAAGLYINSLAGAQSYGYYVYNDVSAPTVVYVYPPIGYGAALNGGNRLSVQIL